MKRSCSDSSDLLNKNILDSFDEINEYKQVLNRIDEVDKQLSDKITSLRRSYSLKTVGSGETSIVSKVMRIFIHHSFVSSELEEGKGYFLITVEGQLLDNKNFHESFTRLSHHFDSIQIYPDKKSGIYQQSLAECNLKAFPEQTRGIHGIRFKIPGDKAMNIKIFLNRNNDLLPRYDISVELRKLLPLIRYDPSENEVLYAFLNYCQSRELIDKKQIKCNEELQQLFNCEYFPIISLKQKLIDHLLPCKPISVDYHLSLNGTTYPNKYNMLTFNRGSSRLFDIEVNMEDTYQSRLIDLVNNLSILSLGLTETLEQNELKSKYIAKKINLQFEKILNLRKLKSGVETNTSDNLLYPLISSSSSLDEIADISGIPKCLLDNYDPRVQLDTRPTIKSQVLVKKTTDITREVAVQSQLLNSRQYISEHEYHSILGKRWHWNNPSSDGSYSKEKIENEPINNINENNNNNIGNGNMKKSKGILHSALHNCQKFVDINS